MPETKLTPAQRRDIARRASNGESVKDLAQEFGLHQMYVYKIWRNYKSPENLQEAREEYETRKLTTL